MSRKVLIVPTGGLRREGIVSSILSLVRHMPREGIDLYVAAVHNNEPDVLDEFRALGCTIVETPDRRNNTAAYIRFLFAHLREEGYDVVHVHGSSSVMAIELRLAQIAGVKVRIAHSRNTRSDDPRRDRLLRPLFRGSWTKALACGVEAGEWLFGSSHFEVLHNGRELDEFAFDPLARTRMRREVGTDDCVAVGFVGNINYVKNQRFLLEVYEVVLKSGVPAKLFIIGDGPDKEEIERLIADKSLEELVVLTGRVSNVQDYLQAMDVMVLPSLFEGLPNVVLEWQASGLPCLVSDVVTKECATSSLVHFCSLDEGAEAWASHLIRLVEGLGVNSEARVERSEDAILGLRANGFEVNATAKRLYELYVEGF